MEILSHPRNLYPLREFLFRIARGWGFSREGALDLKIACGEALLNIIVHAYGEKTDGPIFIEMRTFGGYMEIEFQDFGIQRHIRPGMIRDLADYRESGLGIYLISKLTDYHFYDQNRKRGTRLVLKKRIV